MIPELDIWRSAQAMAKRYGEGAATEAAMRADEFLDQGNIDGRRVTREGPIRYRAFPKY